MLNCNFLNRTASKMSFKKKSYFQNKFSNLNIHQRENMFLKRFSNSACAYYFSKSDRENFMEFSHSYK